jgi:hypothetical protein
LQLLLLLLLLLLLGGSRDAFEPLVELHTTLSGTATAAAASTSATNGKREMANKRRRWSSPV